MSILISDSVDPATPRPNAGADKIMDVDQTNFMAEVIEASKSLPVLVDFWATWCSPCKTLTPILEKVTRAAGGRLKLVKIDVDKNRPLVQQLTQMGLPLQSIPTVVAFWQGQIASEPFQGALPESEVKRYVDALLKLAGSTAPAADLVAEAKLLLEAGQGEEAARLYTAALHEDAQLPEAWAGLVRGLLVMGDEARAEEALADVPPGLLDHAELSGAKAALVLAAEGRKAQAARASLEARLAVDAHDFHARYDLANALNASGDRDAAADALLEIVQVRRDWNEEAARLQLLKFFEAWGLTDPSTILARRKLSALLFS